MTTATNKLEALNREELLKTTRRLLAEADALSSRIAAVNEIGIAINQSLDIDAILRVVAKQAKWLLDFEHCSVCLQKDDVWHTQTLFGPEQPEGVDLLQAENIGPVLQYGQPKLIYEGSPASFLTQYASQIIIPLAADKQVLGTINFATTVPRFYTQDDMRIGYMLSLQLSSALQNARTLNELKITQAQLRERIEELDAYGHTIAHDLKSPLSSILLSHELMLMKFRDTLPEEAIDYLTLMRNSGKQMHRMIDQLLWLAKLRHADEAITPVDVGPVIQEAMCRFIPTLAERNINICLEPDIPPALGHAQWIEEVFANLISNAIKYMGENNPEPCITIRGLQQDHMVRYEVCDTGVGIKPEDQERLFEMFTRLHTVKTDGLGLGLSIVHRIINRLNGQIGVESALGEGTTFWFRLPAVEEKADGGKA